MDMRIGLKSKTMKKLLLVISVLMLFGCEQAKKYKIEQEYSLGELVTCVWHDGQLLKSWHDPMTLDTKLNIKCDRLEQANTYIAKCIEVENYNCGLEIILEETEIKKDSTTFEYYLEWADQKNGKIDYVITLTKTVSTKKHSKDSTKIYETHQDFEFVKTIPKSGYIYWGTTYIGNTSFNSLLASDLRISALYTYRDYLTTKKLNADDFKDVNGIIDIDIQEKSLLNDPNPSISKYKIWLIERKSLNWRLNNEK